MFVQGLGMVLVLVNKQANGNCNSIMGQSFYSPICHHLDLHTVTFHIPTHTTYMRCKTNQRKYNL